jgi:cyanophycinase
MSSSEPHESGQWYVEQFKKLGARDVEYHVLTKEESLKQDSTKILDNVGGIYFSGGDQTRLADALVGTPIHRRLLEIYENGGVIGGSSAGAAVMSEIMITGEEKREVESGYEFEIIKASNIVTEEGFGFMKTAIVDQHFVRRKRHNRLISLVAENPRLLGIGIDERTGIIVKPDDTFEVAGGRNVIIYDATEEASINIEADQTISGYNLAMHILKAGDCFDLKAKKVLK